MRDYRGAFLNTDAHSELGAVEGPIPGELVESPLGAIDIGLVDELEPLGRLRDHGGHGCEPPQLLRDLLDPCAAPSRAVQHVEGDLVVRRVRRGRGSRHGRREPRALPRPGFLAWEGLPLLLLCRAHPHGHGCLHGSLISLTLPPARPLS